VTRARRASLITFAILSVALAGVFAGVLNRRAPTDLSDPFVFAAIVILAGGLSALWTLVWCLGFGLTEILLKQLRRRIPLWLVIAVAAALGGLSSLALVAVTASLISTDGELTHIVRPSIVLGVGAGVFGAFLKKVPSA